MMKMMSSCASCGILPECDVIKLKECTACDLVRYCSDECQKNHTTQHEEACKKRAAELRDELLFKQPDSSYLGDCPICMIPLQLDLDKSNMMTCCSKVICNGCYHANLLREEEEMLKHSCPFCRKPIPDTDEESDKRIMKRIEMDDPVAMRQEGLHLGKKGDYQSALRYLTRAAELGDVEAHHKVSYLYQEGHGVDKDKEKEKMHHHLEEATIGGHPYARYNLGCVEWNNNNKERAVKHLTIAATQGHDQSIKTLMSAFKIGKVGKEVLAVALRAHHAAVNATKSPQREAAEAAEKIIGNVDNVHVEASVEGT
jgi:tetratricopeptide (TPR) repeat protein